MTVSTSSSQVRTDSKGREFDVVDLSILRLEVNGSDAAMNAVCALDEQMQMLLGNMEHAANDVIAKAQWALAQIAAVREGRPTGLNGSVLGHSAAHLDDYASQYQGVRTLAPVLVRQAMAHPDTVAR